MKILLAVFIAALGVALIAFVWSCKSDVEQEEGV